MNNDFLPQNILDTYWDGNLPVNFEHIASKLNIPVQEIDMDGDSFGFLETKGEQHFIYIKKGFGHKNQIIAFLFAKILVGISDGGISVKHTDFSSTDACFHSLIAQKYLHQYLIPERTLIFCIKEKGSNLSKLSKQFDVSETLMLQALTLYKLI